MSAPEQALVVMLLALLAVLEAGVLAARWSKAQQARAQRELLARHYRGEQS